MFVQTCLKKDDAHSCYLLFAMELPGERLTGTDNPLDISGQRHLSPNGVESGRRVRGVHCAGALYRLHLSCLHKLKEIITKIAFIVF